MYSNGRYCERGISITSGIEFLRSKNKFWMYDESPIFSGKIHDVLTINATSENQAVEVYVARERFGSWEPGLLPLEGMSDQKNYGVLRLFPMNWETQTSAVDKSE
ncbi:MAG: hypothetical protein HC785_22505 [Calothrix sp. CSU_2_0]|nr:hypothetical protein [Calothrix sp. CSU_2_0]